MVLKSREDVSVANDGIPGLIGQPYHVHPPWAAQMIRTRVPFLTYNTVQTAPTSLLLHFWGFREVPRQNHMTSWHRILHPHSTLSVRL